MHSFYGNKFDVSLSQKLMKYFDQIDLSDAKSSEVYKLANLKSLIIYFNRSRNHLIKYMLFRNRRPPEYFFPRITVF